MLKDGDGKENDRLKRSILEYGQKFLFLERNASFIQRPTLNQVFKLISIWNLLVMLMLQPKDM